MSTYLASDDVLEAVDDMIDALHVEPDEREAFAIAGDAFIDTMHRHVEELGDPVTSWPPLATMVCLEVELMIVDEDRGPDRAAAVKCVRDFLTARQAWRAQWN